MILAARGNIGFGAANNYLAREAKGEWLLLLSPDTRLEPSAIDHLLAAAELDRSFAILGGLSISPKGEPLAMSRLQFPTLGLILRGAIDKGGVPRPAWIAALLVAVLVVAAAIGSATLGGRAADSLARFGDTGTDRPEMWEDAVFAAREYSPVGSGMGTFDEVFQLHESLEYISPRRAGRAHSDVLEVVIAGGLFSAALVLGWLAWCAAAVLRAPSYWRWTALGAGTGVLVLLLQSLLDYPLRNQTLLCMAAVLVVLLAGKRGRKA